MTKKNTKENSNWNYNLMKITHADSGGTCRDYYGFVCV